MIPGFIEMKRLNFGSNLSMMFIFVVKKQIDYCYRYQLFLPSKRRLTSVSHLTKFPTRADGFQIPLFIFFDCSDKILATDI
jgi:hypothetical protein